MAKLTTQDIQQLTDEWGELEKKANDAEGRKAKDLTPIAERFNQEIEGVTRKHDTKISKFRDRQAEIANAVAEALKKRSKDVVITGEIAVAEKKTVSQVGPRVIDFNKFWDVAKAKGAAAVECINVQVAKAEKLLGKKTIDEISTRDKNTVTTVELRLKA